MVRNGVLRGPGESDIQRPAKYVVRLRGLPFETNNDDIKEFFEGTSFQKPRKLFGTERRLH